MAHSSWLPALQKVNETDGTRILQHRFADRGALSQFFRSTRPEVSPVQLIRGVKGRLQGLARDQLPKALRRNYALRSIRFSRELLLPNTSKVNWTIMGAMNRARSLRFGRRAERTK